MKSAQGSPNRHAAFFRELENFETELPPAPLQRKNKLSGLARVSLLVIALFILIALVGPFLAPHDPTYFFWEEGNLPPAWVKDATPAGQAKFILGSDTHGRDFLSRLLYGTRTSMLIALVAAPLAAALGLSVGLLAGYAGGRTDNLLMRATDIFSAFPAILFAVLIVLIFHNTPFGNWLNGLGVLILAFFLTGWVSLARLVRSAVLTTRQQQYVEAARAVGLTDRRIILRYILPNIMGLVVVWVMASIPRVLLLEALLGYIGIGITPDIENAGFVVTSWGALFLDGRQAIHSNPIRLIAPALLVILCAVSFTLLSDELRDRRR